MTVPDTPQPHWTVERHDDNAVWLYEGDVVRARMTDADVPRILAALNERDALAATAQAERDERDAAVGQAMRLRAERDALAATLATYRDLLTEIGSDDRAVAGISTDTYHRLMDLLSDTPDTPGRS